MTNTAHTSVFQKLGVSRISHVAFLVDDLAAEIRTYAALFNISTWYRPHFVRQDLHYRGAPVAAEVNNVVGYAGPVQVELFTVKGGDGSLFDRRQHGRGLHHLGCHVRDSAAVIRAAEALDALPVQSQTLQSKGGAITTCVFLDTEKICGVPLELLETRLMGIPMGQSRLIMNLGRLLGDCSRYCPA